MASIMPSDVGAAVVNRWNSASLDSNIPGSIKTGLGVAPKSSPYAMLKVKGSKDPQFYTEAGAGAPYIAYFQVTVQLYGVGEVVIGNLLKTVASALNQQDWSVTGGTFQHAYLAGGSPTLELDPSRKSGEDVWIGTLIYDVAVSGTL